MRSRRLSWLVALGLVAGAQPPGPEEPGVGAIFYPYIPNGVDLEAGTAPGTP